MSIRLIALLLAALLLGGCTALPAEERAFAVALGIDRTEDGWRVSVRIPTYQSTGGYATVSAEGRDVATALAALNAASPMQLHYGQLRLVVVTETLARTEDFPSALAALHRRGDLRGEAALCVTEAPLGDVMEALKPATGSRLSKSLELLLEARQKGGTAPRTTLDAWRLAGVRRQCLPIRLTLADGGGESSIELAGGWLTDASGRVTGMLTADEMQLAGLLLGTWRQGEWRLPGLTVTLLDAKASAGLEQGRAAIRLTVRCLGRGAGAEEIRREAQEALVALTARLQEARCDALALGGQELAGYPSMAAWLASGWPERYAALPVRVEVEVDCEAMESAGCTWHPARFRFSGAGGAGRRPRRR